MRERIVLREEIKDAYERLKVPFAIFQFISKGIFVVAVSEGYCELFGYRDHAQAYADLEKEAFSDIHPCDADRVEEEARRFISGDGTTDFTYRAYTKDGSKCKVIHAVAKHVYQKNGEHLAHIWYMDETDDINQKVTQLQESVYSLLTNMPAMTFSKDMKTGKYMACNQAFADYAHKEKPEGVVGLTDYEIFDKNTAKHFVEDDQKAMSMEKPYIFFEDVSDAAGNRRQFQTTKLKFVDNYGRQCLLGLCQDVTEAMQIKKEYDERLALANRQANIDALTGISNKHAYQELEGKINLLIGEYRQPDFAVIIFDVNGLKEVNDTLGHQEGDKYICSACKKICSEFKHSPVFRIGGDEFVVLSQGEDYDNIDSLIDSFNEYNKNAIRTGGIVIACGMAKYKDDKSVESVFERADKNMYENKSRLKSSDACLHNDLRLCDQHKHE